MDVTKAQAAPALLDQNDAQLRAQTQANAIKQFQARYGEKPAETRPVKKSLDKDDFMRIMITEMKHQDPTKPMDSDRMATQMAQITSVEQLKNVGNAIEKLADKNSTTDRLAMSAMIGKSVTVDKGRFIHQKGNLSAVNFELPEDAEKVRLVILNEKGDEIAKRELEPMKAGNNVYNWDGINESNVSSPNGTYMVRVEAENAKGAKIKVDPISKDSIVGVSFEGGETNFLVGDPKSPQKIAMKSVIRIDDPNNRGIAVQPRTNANQAIATDRPQVSGGGESENVAAPQAQAQTQASAQKQNEIGAGLPPGLQEKLKAELAARDKDNVEEKPQGFPNGLGE